MDPPRAYGHDPLDHPAPPRAPGAGSPRALVSRAFTGVQDVVYVALAILLAVSAVAVLVHAGVAFTEGIVGRTLDVRGVVGLLDRILLALMIVELLYTVQVSFREHTLVPEPFVLVALIATIRRILVITAEFGAQGSHDEKLFQQVMWELGLLTVLIGVLVVSLIALRRGAGQRATT